MHQRTPSLPHYCHEHRVPNLKISTISTRVFKQGAEASSAEGPRVLGFLSRSLQGSPGIGIPLGWIVHPGYRGAQHTPSYNQVQTVILLCPRCWSWVGLPLPSRSQVAQSCCLGTWQLGGLQGRTRPHRGGHGSRRRWCQPHSDGSTVDHHAGHMGGRRGQEGETQDMAVVELREGHRRWAWSASRSRGPACSEWQPLPISRPGGKTWALDKRTEKHTVFVTCS